MSRILVVDDEHSIATLVGELLEDEGFTVDVAYDGHTALARVQDARPDLIISDLMMPGMDGVALCHRLQADPAHQGLPIILMSAGRKPLGLGVTYAAFVRKPFTLNDILDTITTVLDRKW
jgi:CheY-like chemotaxis protein